MGHLYGDATPFPYELDLLDTIRAVVDCGVALAQAQHQIDRAKLAALHTDRERSREQERLNAVYGSVKVTMTAFISNRSTRIQALAQRLLEETVRMIEREQRLLDAQQSSQLDDVRAAQEQGRQIAWRALERLLGAHLLPGGHAQSRLTLADEGYRGQILVTTPAAIEAAFELDLDKEGPWRRARRAGELMPDFALDTPRRGSWMGKRHESQRLSLARLVIGEVARLDGATTVRLCPSKGDGGYELVALPGHSPRVSLHVVDGEGRRQSDGALGLAGANAERAQRFLALAVSSLEAASARRGRLVAARFDGKELHEHDEPGELAQRLVATLAPIVQEVGRRSGAPGELVVRRDLGGGKREELYLQKAELRERAALLPPSQSGLFDAFELAPPARRALLPAGRAPEPAATSDVPTRREVFARVG